MRTFDLAPLYRSTVGFDLMFSMLDELDGVEGSVSGYPPYNIERTAENAYRISLAVAGFGFYTSLAGQPLFRASLPDD